MLCSESFEIFLRLPLSRTPTCMWDSGPARQCSAGSGGRWHGVFLKGGGAPWSSQRTGHLVEGEGGFPRAHFRTYVSTFVMQNLVTPVFGVRRGENDQQHSVLTEVLYIYFLFLENKILLLRFNFLKNVSSIISNLEKKFRVQWFKKNNSSMCLINKLCLPNRRK